MKSWDTGLSAGIGLVVGLLSAATPMLPVGNAPLIAATPTCFAIFGIAATWNKKVADETLANVFGKLVRLADPRHEGLLMPYRIIAVVALAATAVNFLFAMLIGLVPQAGAAAMYGVSAWLTSWAVLGLLDLYFLNQRHEGYRAQEQTMRDDLERARAKAR